MALQVLVVEDTASDLQAYLRDFPSVFDDVGVQAELHGCDDFDVAIEMVADSSRRFDLIISDTYRGKPADGDAKVLDMVSTYRVQGKRFCPIVVYSSSAKPHDLEESDFVAWADKAKNQGIEDAIRKVLLTGVPQIARKLHDELERSAGSFLWEFLEKNWPRLSQQGGMRTEILERLIRRRAAAQIGDLEFIDDAWVPISQRAASEYYIYPRVHTTYYGLGDVLRQNQADGWSVILTPHCHLHKQPNQPAPRADFVLTVKAIPAKDILGNQIDTAKALTSHDKRHEKLLNWSQSPARTPGKPAGRHWYMPAFLDIPHLYCDFLQVESIPYNDMDKFEAIATLVPPYAEAMQSCFAGFYASVGIPLIQPSSIEDLLS